MKKFLYVLLFLTAALSAAEKKVLTIGNSFTWSLQRDLPAIAKAQGDQLKLSFANHGGCSFDRHWKYVSEEEAQKETRHYRLGKKRAKLREVLASDKWDIVTIQQASPKSWIKGSFYPEAAFLVNYVRKHAPGAEIVLQQTWSYRSDAPLLKKWKISPEKMYEGICANYKEASGRFSCRVIPAGLAVKLAYAGQTRPFVPPDTRQFKTLKENEIPAQPGSLHKGWRWLRNKKNGGKDLRLDSIHLNDRGEYLQSCVWYGFIFKKSPLSIKYNGRGLTSEDAAFLRQCADKALKEYRP
ncbi:MAG: DUF4886 domain-containing protein [Lentisphaeria bacterium]|nr:DUF4886 domain-containing protein [Lentisphaeria bacterium]